MVLSQADWPEESLTLAKLSHHAPQDRAAAIFSGDRGGEPRPDVPGPVTAQGRVRAASPGVLPSRARGPEPLLPGKRAAPSFGAVGRFPLRPVQPGHVAVKGRQAGSGEG